MLTAIVRFAIRYYGIVIALSAVLAGYGSYRFAQAGLDIFPEFSPKRVIIQTEAPGLSAEQVEILVTQQIENALAGLIGLQTLRSESIQGLSIVTAIFGERSDIYRNRQQVGERLASLAGKLPNGAGAPMPVPLSSSSATLLTIGLTSERKDLLELRSLVDWTLLPRLLAVPGVADVNVFGGAVQQLQIQADPERLKHFNLALSDVVRAAVKAGQIRGGGFIENANQRFTLQAGGKPLGPEQLRKIVVARVQGNNVALGDAADVEYAAEPPIGAAQIMGKDGIVMMLIGQYGADTLEVSKAVERQLAEFESLFAQQGITLHTRLFRPADYIETSVSNLSGHLLLGGLFVLIVLYAFLYNARTAFISATAIPVSLLTATLVLLESGVNLNIMVLGGLAIALGEVVDDAIIDTENIFRRLRENRLLAEPLPAAQVVQTASLEVRGSVVYASFIVALAFVPLLTLSGVAGRLFAPLGYSYILAILMSLLVALTLTPALCYLLLRNAIGACGDPPLIRILKPAYSRVLHCVSRRFRYVLPLSVALCVLGAAVLLRLDGKFLPELREGHYIVHTASIPGTSLQESIRIGKQLGAQFRQIPGVLSVSQWAGRAERGADTYGSHYSEYEVRLEALSGAGQQRVLERLREILADFPGIAYEANTFLTERVDETISGYTAPVAVNLYGNDLRALDAQAQQVAEIMRGIPGATGIQLRSPPGTPLLQIEPDLDRLAYWGLHPDDAFAALQAAYEGAIVGKSYQGNRLYNIAVTLPPALRKRPESIAELPLRSGDGQLLALGQIAAVRHDQGRYNILHQGAQRKQTVTCNVVGRGLDTFMRELQSKVLKDVRFAAGVYPEFTGAAVEQAQAREQLIVHSLLAGAGVLLLIFIAIGELRQVLLTLVNLPFALLGGVAAVILTGAALSVGSVVGFVTLFGITVRNSIMLISHYRHLVVEAGKPWNLDTVVRGAQERLPSILMTALVTALAMLPIAVNSDNPGREIMGPMAAIIIGGLVSSTALNLLILPALLLRYGKFRG
jgi:CzcA family heavy metal efflux pump